MGALTGSAGPNRHHHKPDVPAAMVHALSFVFRLLHLLCRRRHIIAIILVMQCLHEAYLAASCYEKGAGKEGSQSRGVRETSWSSRADADRTARVEAVVIPKSLGDSREAIPLEFEEGRILSFAFREISGDGSEFDHLVREGKRFSLGELYGPILPQRVLDDVVPGHRYTASRHAPR